MKNNAAKNYEEQAVFLAHEIKNPLAVIKANTQLIELENEGKNEKSFKTIYECIDKINSLIKENTDYIKNTAGDIYQSDIVLIIESIIDKYSQAYNRKFDFICSIESIRIDCKKELMESLFENLIKNAVEATCDGDRITAEVKTAHNKAVITITDNGCGISENDINRIGDLFYTTKKGGSGIGLFMCKRIAEQNGGRLKVSRRKPKGTKVTVELKIE
ncbi:MAG: HAMP domain-containing sensor histidine kinase [Clostridia bacterium]|nr:HAMP domain-containing sensor histidine kinase [Clostridia bacterium]